MTILNGNESLVLIIDIQEKLLNAAFNKDLLLKNALIMTKTAKILDIPVVITEQYPKGLGNTVSQIAESKNTNTKTFEKVSFSALDNEEIFSALKNTSKKQIILFGIETHICVNQTANALAEAGYDVTVIKDACGSRCETEHLAGLDRMKENGVHIITTEIALFEWLKTSRHTKFKEIQNLIK